MGGESGDELLEEEEYEELVGVYVRNPNTGKLTLP